ncbi:MAG: hypothetical protein LBL08_02530 [Candidatus Nomurabacteria bacterium]|jgi:hypothetical protein|nr:hypothetical protein [Candidatus Nomurabacteria bacterium]
MKLFKKKVVKKAKKPLRSIKKYHVAVRWWVRFWRALKRWCGRQAKIHRDFLARRPHRSLFLTKRRDYVRSFKISGYLAFSHEVWQTIWKNRAIFIKFTILYAIFSLVLVGTLNQSNYLAMRDSVTSAVENLGVGDVFSLFTNAITSGSGEEATMTSQLVAGLLLIFGWLVVVWILRYRLSGNKIRLRDALYNAGAPLVATFILLLIMVLQLIPFAIVLLAYSAVSGIGLINWSIDIENMAAWCALAVVAVMTLYWMVTSFVALIYITVPGVYPLQAIKLAGDRVVGRRMRILLRLIFMALPMAVMWAVILVPIILLDNWVKIDWLPLVPLGVLLLSTLTLVWVGSYIYLLYRRLLDDNAPPAKR